MSYSGKTILLTLLSLTGFVDAFFMFGSGANQWPHWFNPFAGMLIAAAIPFWAYMLAIFPNKHQADKKNISPCFNCGKDRPYPTEPGRWEYKFFTRNCWNKVTVVKSDDDEVGLEIILDGETEPTWWPRNAQWRQIK